MSWELMIIICLLAVLAVLVLLVVVLAVRLRVARVQERKAASMSICSQRKSRPASARSPCQTLAVGKGAPMISCGRPERRRTEEELMQMMQDARMNLRFTTNSASGRPGTCWERAPSLKGIGSRRASVYKTFGRDGAIGEALGGRHRGTSRRFGGRRGVG